MPHPTLVDSISSLHARLALSSSHRTQTVDHTSLSYLAPLPSASSLSSSRPLLHRALLAHLKLPFPLDATSADLRFFTFGIGIRKSRRHMHEFLGPGRGEKRIELEGR